MTRIRWIDHACYLLEHGPLRLARDPWLDGPAFDRGWELLAPTRVPLETRVQPRFIGQRAAERVRAG